MKAKDAYASYGGIICNICGDLYSNDSMIYHCPKNKFITHPQGYDLCETCAMNPQAKKKKIRCDCGANLVKTQANMVYSGTGVYCNACYIYVRGSNQIYHCPQPSVCIFYLFVIHLKHQYTCIKYRMLT